MDVWLASAGLAIARCLPVTWMVPAFGGRAVMAPVRLGLALCLAMLALPAITAQSGLVGLGPVGLALLAAREGGVGVVLAFLLSTTFRAAESAGRLMDLARGANTAEILAPLSGERESPLSLLTGMLAVVVFLELGGLPRVAAALALSYQAVPVGGWGTAGAWQDALMKVVPAAATLIEAAVSFAAPVLVAAILVDVVLGFVARAAPSTPVFFVGLPVKALAGVGALLVSVGTLRAAWEMRLADLPGWLLRVLGQGV